MGIVAFPVSLEHAEYALSMSYQWILGFCEPRCFTKKVLKNECATIKRSFQFLTRPFLFWADYCQIPRILSVFLQKFHTNNGWAKWKIAEHCLQTADYCNSCSKQKLYIISKTCFEQPGRALGSRRKTSLIISGGNYRRPANIARYYERNFLSGNQGSRHVLTLYVMSCTHTFVN